MPRPSVTRANPYTPTRGVAAGVTFTSERQYRNFLARAKGYRSWAAQQEQARRIRSTEDLARLRPAEQAARGRALEALGLMRRDGLTLGKAAKAVNTTPAAVKRHAGAGLTREGQGRYVAKPVDRLYRPMRAPTPAGVVTLDVRDSRAASKVGDYWNAVRRYLATGDETALHQFRGRRGGVTVGKRFYPFVTDPDHLDALFDTGDLDFDDIYDLARAA